MSAAFDPAAFVADLRAAGCRVVLSTPGTRFGPGDEAATYIIGPADGHGFGDAYSDVMMRWADALAASRENVERVVAHLTAAWEAEA